MCLTVFFIFKEELCVLHSQDLHNGVEGMRTDIADRYTSVVITISGVYATAASAYAAVVICVSGDCMEETPGIDLTEVSFEISSSLCDLEFKTKCSSETRISN